MAEGRSFGTTAITTGVFIYGVMLAARDFAGNPQPHQQSVAQMDEAQPWRPRGAARVVVQICNS